MDAHGFLFIVDM